MMEPPNRPAGSRDGNACRPWQKRISLVLLVSLMGLTLGKLLLIASVSSPAVVLDAREYLELGQLAAAGDVWLYGRPIAYRTPVYPWLIAIAIQLRGLDQDGNSAEQIVAIMLWVHVVLRWMTIFVAGSLATHLYRLTARDAGTEDPRGIKWLEVAVWAMALPAISAATYVHVLLTETWFTFCLMVHLWFVVQHARRPGIWTANAAAVSFVATLLTRPIVLLMWIPTILLWLASWIGRRPSITIKRLATISLLMVLTAASLLSPWWLRNARLFGEVFITKFVGRNVWIVTFQPGSGAGLPIVDNESSRRLLRTFDLTPSSANAMPITEALSSWRHTWTTHRRLQAAGMTDPQIDDLMKQVAMDAAWEHRIAFVAMAFRRMVNFWRTSATDLPIGTDEKFLTQNPDSGYLSTLARMWIRNRFSRHVWLNTAVASVMVTSLVGLMIHRPTRWAGGWLAMILAYFTTVTGVLEIPDYRYRMVLEPLVVVVVSLACATLLTHRRSWGQSSDAHAKVAEHLP